MGLPVLQKVNQKGGIIHQNPLVPFIDPRLIEWLQKCYPDRLPDDPVTDVTVARLIGQQDIIRLLDQHNKAQRQQEGQ